MKSPDLILINPVNFIAVDKSNQVLLAKRTKPGWNAQGKWCFPGGAVENGETFEQTVVREIKEELGCNITQMKYFKSFSMQIESYLARSVYFYGELPSEITLKRDELSEYKWFNLNDPKILELNYAFNQRDVMKDFIKFWKDIINHEAD